VIVARAFLEKLFSSFSLPLPDQFKTPDPSPTSPNDTLPSGISEEEVGYISAFALCASISILSADLAPAPFVDDGLAHSFFSPPPTTGESGNEYVEMETILVRLDEGWAPKASSPVWSWNSIVAGHEVSPSMHVSYDAIVCVKMYEPWIVQIYNSSLGVPTTMNIVGKSATADFQTDYRNREPYTEALNYTGKDSAYYNGYAGGFSFERC